MKILLSFSLLLFLVFVGCKTTDPEENILPEPLQINTQRAFLTGPTSVKVEALIGASSTHTIVQRGICFSESNEPTLADVKIPSGAGSGAFSVEIGDLTPDQTYHFRAFAITETDTVLGNTVQISTTITSALQLDSLSQTSVWVSGSIPRELQAVTQSSGLCWSTASSPVPSPGQQLALQPGNFTFELTDLSVNTSYYFRTYVILSADTLFSESVKATTLPLPGSATLEAIAVNYAIVKTTSEVLQGSGALEAVGICLATHPQPTVSDVVHVLGQDMASAQSIIRELQPATAYYARPFASNEGGTSYGPEVSFTTEPERRITFTLNAAEKPTPDQMDAYIRMTRSAIEAIRFHEEYTSFRKHVWLNYDPGVPTADANIEGWMRFGANRSFMNVRTMLHEIAHTVGIGTSTGFYRLMVDNKWTGAHGNAALRAISGNPNDQINQSGVHIWPHGLNFDSEGTTDDAFKNHCLVLEGMRLDGM